MGSDDSDLATKRFIVCIDEIQQNFAFGEQFAGRYTKTVTLSDGSTRTIELTPIIRNGRPVVELKDTGGLTYMGLNGTTTNGNLMVQIRDLDEAEAQARRELPESPVFPPGTALKDIPEFVPAGFAQGLEILNDNTTPMEFVVSVLGSCVGLSPEDSYSTMLGIHAKGGALLPTSSLDEAQRIAARLTEEAVKHGYPLACSAVSIARGPE
jgi:ATP-dependent Clp protease adapter protein ClpS